MLNDKIYTDFKDLQFKNSMSSPYEPSWMELKNPTDNSFQSKMSIGRKAMLQTYRPSLGVDM